jgi:hypothetical protein
MSEAAEEAKKEFAKQAVALVFMVTALVIMTAVHDPDFIKTAEMKFANKSSRILGVLARRLGHSSMGTELRTGQQQYTVPYLLSRMRDKMTEYYEKARG